MKSLASEAGLSTGPPHIVYKSMINLLLYGTVNGELKFIQNRSKKRAKGRLYTTGKVIQRLFIIDLYT